MNKKIGFIGLGNMGGPMAKNVAKAGFDLTVYDVRPEAMAELGALGAKQARSPKEIGESCDIIQVVVVNDTQLEKVILGGDGGEGVLSGTRPGTIIAIHSTVKPETCKLIAARAKAKGVGVLDAPISGSALRARNATLSLMIGGSKSDLDACRSVFDAIGSDVFHIGDVGTGQVAKIANNIVALIDLEATREGLRLARLSGIDELTMLKVLKASTGNNWMVENWEDRKSVAQHYTTGPEGLGKVRHKDMILALAAANEVGAELPVTALVTQLTKRPSND